MKNIIGIADDILILGHDKYGNDHDLALTEFLKVAREDRPKGRVQGKKMLFFGTTIITDRHQHTDDKIIAIQEMEQA